MINIVKLILYYEKCFQLHKKKKNHFILFYFFLHNTKHNLLFNTKRNKFVWLYNYDKNV